MLPPQWAHWGWRRFPAGWADSDLWSPRCPREQRPAQDPKQHTHTTLSARLQWRIILIIIPLQTLDVNNEHRSLTQRSYNPKARCVCAEQLFRRWAVHALQQVQRVSHGALCVFVCVCVLGTNSESLNSICATCMNAGEHAMNMCMDEVGGHGWLLGAGCGPARAGLRHRKRCPLAHLHSGWHLFAQRLLRQSRVNSDLHHAAVEASVSCGFLVQTENARWWTAGLVYSQQVRLVTHFATSALSSASGCWRGINVTSKTEEP